MLHNHKTLTNKQKQDEAHDDQIKTKDNNNKTEDDYIDIIDKLTAEMFDYEVDKDDDNYFVASLPRSSTAKMTRSESEYERVMRELDKLQSLNKDCSRPGSSQEHVSSSSSEIRRRQGHSVESIEKLLDHPDKIVITERYQPHLDQENDDDEDDSARARKSEEIR